MKRLAIPALSILALAACEPEVPDSAAGVGFGDYNNYQHNQAQIRAQREAQLSSVTNVRPPEATGAPSPSGQAAAPGVSSAELAAAGIGAPATANNDLITPAPGTPLAATAVGAAYVGGGNVAASPGQAYPAANTGAQTTPYQPAAVQSVPSRPRDTGPDLVAYALSTTNSVGQQAYKRTLPSQSKAQRKCAKYASSDVAQRAFLEAGGPVKDRHGIDPDGDGFACSWNPEPFRRAVGR